MPSGGPPILPGPDETLAPAVHGVMEGLSRTISFLEDDPRVSIEPWREKQRTKRPRASSPPADLPILLLDGAEMLAAAELSPKTVVSASLTAGETPLSPVFRAKHRSDNPLHATTVVDVAEGEVMFRGHADDDEVDCIYTPGPMEAPPRCELKLEGCDPLMAVGKKVLAVENHLFLEGKPVRPRAGAMMGGLGGDVGPVVFLSGGGIIYAVGEGQRPGPIACTWCDDHGPMFAAGETVGIALSEPAF